MRNTLICFLLILSSGLRGQELEPEWIKQLGFTHTRADLLFAFEKDPRVKRLPSETTNRVSLIDTGWGVEYDMFFDQQSGYGFIYQIIFLSEYSLSKAERYAAAGSKGFKGTMPFGLKMGMNHNEVKEVMGSFFYSGSNPKRVQYKDIFSFGKDSEIEFNFNDDGLQYLRLLIQNPASINTLYQNYGEDFNKVLKAGYQATISWYGSFLGNLARTLSESRGYVEKPLLGLGGAAVQSNDSKWQASWCDQYPELSKARFDLLAKNINLWVAEVNTQTSEQDLILQKGNTDNELFWVTKADASGFRTFNKYEVFRLAWDQNTSTVVLENIHSEYFAKQSSIQAKACR